MGIRFIPQRTGDHARVRADGPTILVTTDAGIVEARSGGAVTLIDRSSLFLLPKGSLAEVLPKSPVGHLLVLTVTSALAQETADTYDGDIDPRALDRYLAQRELLPRTNWMSEICHRYLFERAVCKKKDNLATRFLEIEIVKELYFLSQARERASDRRSVVAAETPLVARAVRAIEARLFEADVVSGLARACATSESTLLRAFKREMGTGPAEFVRARRLDEARLLLLSHRFSVGEVATKVGYRSFAAFSEAFRARFGRTPSAVARSAS